LPLSFNIHDHAKKEKRFALFSLIFFHFSFKIQFSNL
jgi:hypothetical protein